MGIVDNYEINQILDKLESLEDEVYSVKLLSEFNSSTKALGEILMNEDDSLSTEEWKLKCDEAKKIVDRVLKKIREA